MTHAIAYYRVSTQRQGQSGLGLEAQRQVVENFAKSRGMTIIAEFQEVESGKKKNRPQLAKALAMAKNDKATLLIAKLDRLARDVAFTSSLQKASQEKGGVKFVACDMPDANELTINIMAAIAQHEARTISERTKAALEQAKKHGTELGTRANLTEEGRESGREAMRQGAIDAYQTIIGYAQLMRSSGYSFPAIAKQFNAEGKKTRQGADFHPMTIKRMLERGTE